MSIKGTKKRIILYNNTDHANYIIKKTASTNALRINVMQEKTRQNKRELEVPIQQQSSKFGISSDPMRSKHIRLSIQKENKIVETFLVISRIASTTPISSQVKREASIIIREASIIIASITTLQSNAIITGEEKHKATTIVASRITFASTIIGE